MKVGILQSGYLPWQGFFDLLDRSDLFVFFDDVQWTKRDWRNRNRIRTPDGWVWLTVPTRLDKEHFKYKISEVKIDYSQTWVKKHLLTIKSFYSKSKCFSDIFPMIEEQLIKNYEYIVDLNYGIISQVSKFLGINTEIIYDKDLNIDHNKKKTDRILSVLEKIPNTTHYITSRFINYLDIDMFSERGLEVEWQDYQIPYYNQNCWKSNYFISHLSIIDLLFHHGKDSLEIIRGNMKISKPGGVKIISADHFY